MRLFGEPEGSCVTFHARLYVINVASGRAGDCSRIMGDLAYLIGGLPNYWMEIPFGRTPGRLVAELRLHDRRR